VAAVCFRFPACSLSFRACWKRFRACWLRRPACCLPSRPCSRSSNDVSAANATVCGTITNFSEAEPLSRIGGRVLRTQSFPSPPVDQQNYSHGFHGLIAQNP
jgi:hypothetical protein